MLNTEGMIFRTGKGHLTARNSDTNEMIAGMTFPTLINAVDVGAEVRKIIKVLETARKIFELELIDLTDGEE